jgi:hypothetical protein
VLGLGAKFLRRANKPVAEGAHDFSGKEQCSFLPSLRDSLGISLLLPGAYAGL